MPKVCYPICQRVTEVTYLMFLGKLCNVFTIKLVIAACVFIMLIARDLMPSWKTGLKLLGAEDFCYTAELDGAL